MMLTTRRQKLLHSPLLPAATILIAATLFVGAVEARDGQGLPIAQRAARTFAIPFLKAGASIHGAAGSFWSGFFGSRALESENVRLREEIAALRVDSSRERALDALASVSHHISTNVPYGTWDLIASPVLSGPIAADRQQLWIGRGERDGIARGMVVLSSGGIVGLVTEVMEDSALVELLTDRKSTWGAEIDRRSEFGLVKGTNNPAQVEFHFEKTAFRAEVGDSVVTSGMKGSVAPGGLPFGKISRIEESRSGERIAIVDLPEQPTALRTVFVLPLQRIDWEPAP
jgi:rod shape-determining protein MreC